MIAQSRNIVGVNQTAGALINHRDQGPQLFRARNLGPSAVALAFFRERDGVRTPIGTDSDTKYNSYDTGYFADGSTADFSALSLPGPIAPGTLTIESGGTVPNLEDTEKDGILYVDGAARADGASGSFAALAGESFSVAVDGETTQVITMGTEATIAAAVAAINTQLDGATASAIDADNVRIQSDSEGPDSSIVISAVDAGITTKIGLSATSETTVAGTINYLTGALALAYPGSRAPAAATLATLVTLAEFPVAMTAADTLVVDTDAAGDETATFDAAAAVVTGSGGATAAMANETMDVIVGDTTYHVAFGTEANQAAALLTLNNQIVGALAETVDANNIKITSEQLGTGARIRTANVAAGITTKLGIADAEDESGTGDVADITAVTAAEFKTVVEADTTGLTVTPLQSGKVMLTAATSININATSDLESVLGLTTTLTNVAGSVTPIYADFVTTTSLAASSSRVHRIQNLTEIDRLIVEGVALSTGGARLEVEVTRGW